MENLPKHVQRAVKQGMKVYHFEANDAKVFSLYRGLVISEPLGTTEAPESLVRGLRRIATRSL